MSETQTTETQPSETPKRGALELLLKMGLEPDVAMDAELSIMNPDTRPIFTAAAPKLPPGAQSLCEVCPAAIWKSTKNGWRGLCTVFRNPLMRPWVGLEEPQVQKILKSMEEQDPELLECVVQHCESYVVAMANRALKANGGT